MPRRLRAQPLGIPLHIIKRGSDRQDYFFDEADYLLQHLALIAKRFCEHHPKSFLGTVMPAKSASRIVSFGSTPIDLMK